MPEPADHAAMIEKAARGLRQQGSAGQLAGPQELLGARRSLNPGLAAIAAGGSALSRAPRVGHREPTEPDTAQRRIRSAENNSRLVATPCTAGLSRGSSALPDPVACEKDGPEEAAEDPGGTAELGGSTAAASPPLTVGLRLDLKRPPSRKKDPPSSAATGLGAFAGPIKMLDAFEHRKMRQPIPAEIWGPRPPSRGNAQKKAALLDGAGLGAEIKQVNLALRGRSAAAVSLSVGKMAGKAASEAALGSVAVSSTWATARTTASYSPAEARVPGGGRFMKSRSGSGLAESPGQRLKDLVSVPALEASNYNNGDFVGIVDAKGLKMGGTAGLVRRAPGGWRPLADGLAVEDVEADPDAGLPAGAGWHDFNPPQVSMARPSLVGSGPRAAAHEPLQQRCAAARERGQAKPWATSLDPGFLSLFAS